jgi:monothiol glutaredoxin
MAKLAKPRKTMKAPTVQALDVHELFDLREGKKRSSFVVVDVRTDNERRNIPFEGSQPIEEPEDEAVVAALPRDTKLVVICHRGIRSQKAAERFLEQGFTDVWSLTGGIEAWVRAYGYGAAAAE